MGQTNNNYRAIAEAMIKAVGKGYGAIDAAQAGVEALQRNHGPVKLETLEDTIKEAVEELYGVLDWRQNVELHYAMERLCEML